MPQLLSAAAAAAGAAGAGTGAKLPQQRPLTCTGHTRPVTDVSYSAVLGAGDFYLLSGCKDSNAILRGAHGNWIGTLSGHKGAIWSSRITPDAARSVTGSGDFSAKVWDNRTGQTLSTLPHSHIVRAVDVSDDGRFVLTGGFEKRLRLYDLNGPTVAAGTDALQPAMIREFACPGEVRFAALDSARGLVFNANDKELQVWDLRTSQPLPSRFFDGAITSVRLTEDRSSLICTAGKSVYVFGLDSSELVFSVATPFVTSSASIHPSRDRIVVASSADLWVRTYSIPTGREIEVCKGHHGPIHAVSYSPDGFMYATGSEDGTVRLWETFPGTAYGPWK